MTKLREINYQKIFLVIFFILNLFLTKQVFAQSTTSSSSTKSTGGVTQNGNNATISFTNPLQKDSAEGILIVAMKALRNVVAILAIFMIVVAGVVWITSAGSNRVELAKKMVSGALIGLVLVLGAPSFLKEIYTILGEDISTDNGVTEIKKEVDLNFEEGLYDITLRATQQILAFIGILAILMIIVGGVMMIISGGSKGMETGKKMVTWAIVGLVIALLALVIVNAVVGLFG